MIQQIAHITLLVKDYDEAIDFYTNKLGFSLIKDDKLSESKRWVLVAPKYVKEYAILLVKASNEQQLSCVGNQTGGKVFMFLYTNDLLNNYNDMLSRGVKFESEPINKPHGLVVVFEDLYGNRFDFIEPIN